LDRAHQDELAVVDARAVDQRDVDALAFEVAQLVKALRGHRDDPLPQRPPSARVRSRQATGTSLPRRCLLPATEKFLRAGADKAPQKWAKRLSRDRDSRDGEVLGLRGRERPQRSGG